MTDSPPDVKSVSSIFGFISERGVISGLYFASLCFGLVLGNAQFTIAPQLYIWIAAECALVGLIVSNITFEVFIPLCRWFTSRVTRKSCNKVIGKGAGEEFEFGVYDELRKWREDYLASDQTQHYKARIEKDERLRNTVSYLATSSVLASVMLITACYGFSIRPTVLKLEAIVVGYIGFTSWLGMINRSRTMGRTIGLARLHQLSLETKGTLGEK